MRVTLFYSEGAGDGVSLDRIRGALKRHGHDMVEVVERSHTDRGFETPCDLIVAAGGDGTIGAAARRLAKQRIGIPLAVLPLGTANNIARSLGIRGSMEELISSWWRGTMRPFDLATCRGPWKAHHFTESVGGGLVSEGIAAAAAGVKPEPSEEVTWAASVFRDALDRQRPEPWTIVADATRRSGEFLLVEVMNTPFVGPNLRFSTATTSADGQLTVITAAEDDRGRLREYLTARYRGTDPPLDLPHVHARHVELESAARMHVDDRVHEPHGHGTVTLDVEPAAIQIFS